MAVIHNKTTGEQLTLTVHHSFGRDPHSNNTVLNDVYSSRIHAVIFWDGERWRLMNKSINGTYINGNLITSTTITTINKEDTIHFGNLKSEPWYVIDLDAPRSMLIPVTASLPEIILDDVITLPSEDTPQVTIYQTPDGLWLCESDSGTTTLTTGDLVGTNNQIWRFTDSTPTVETYADKTNSPLHSSDMLLYFNVSQNEEHVSLKIRLKDNFIDLGERTHHYLLLLLARKRLNDQNKKLNISEQGWIDKDTFSKNLGLSENHLNILIYRLRKQCSNTTNSHTILNQIIERRPGELRINCGEIFIQGGNQPLSP